MEHPECHTTAKEILLDLLYPEWKFQWSIYHLKYCSPCQAGPGDVDIIF
jgi:hypothetical protein